VGILLLLLLAFAGPAAAQDGVTYIESGACLFAASDYDGCTAGDAKDGAFQVIEVIDGCTSTDDTFTAKLSGSVTATAQERDDVAFWIGLTDYAADNTGAEPGDGALYGEACYRQIFSPTTTDLTAVKPDTGEGPYASLDSDDDFCGDAQQDVPTKANLPFDDAKTLTLPCIDPDNDGVANIDACVSWENNQNVQCDDVTEALPGTESKCDCGAFNLPGVVIGEKKIIVDKVTPQYPDSAQEFSFTLAGVPSDQNIPFDPVQFTLTDGQTPFDSGALPAGTFSVVEGQPATGWTLEKAECVDAAGASYDPESIDLTGSAKTVTCTFTNTFEPPVTDAWKIVVDKVTPQYPDSAQEFSFTLSGDPSDQEVTFAPVQFTLTGAQAPFESGELPAGTYSVVEGRPATGWTLEKVACVDVAGKPYDPEEIVLTGDPTTVTCTFTNTFEPPDSGVPLPFSYLLIGGAALGVGLVAAGALMQRKARTRSA
jgi:hypothetical protein